ncbi:MAG: BtpA/SgcQ family protein [Acidimicrobiia bacterium]
MIGLPTLIGMVHLGPLPGAPAFAGDLDTVVAGAVRDAETLAEAGFGGLMVENFGDAPFFADTVPTATVAAMTRSVGAVADAVGLPVGVNVLRNDALAALSVAAATGAAFVRVNVLSGSMFTDQGLVEGRAAEVARLRRALGWDGLLMADVFVKHATPPPGLTLVQAVRDLAERSGADAIVVSGTGTGQAVDLGDARIVAREAPGMPVVIGSGATPETIPALLEVADAVIVGTAVKIDGVTTNPVDPTRAREVADAAVT